MKIRIRSTKITIIMTLALSAIMFVGCSPESPLNEPIGDLTENQQDFTTKGTINLPIEFEGFGNMVLMPRGPFNICEKLHQIECSGNTNGSSLGSFNTEARICKDNGTTQRVEGKHTFENKDELYFYSDQWGVDKNGQFWMKYIYYGGTGYFEGASGTVSVNEDRDWYSPSKGNYTNHGVGTIIINK